MPADHYANSGRRWAKGAESVYRPIAAALIAASPHPLAGRLVLDAGARTGAVSAVLRHRQARTAARAERAVGAAVAPYWPMVIFPCAVTSTVPRQRP